MNKQLIKDFFGWGFLLWLIGYILGFILFGFVPTSMIGWILTPIGTSITLWVLAKKITMESFQHYVVLATTWTAIAIVFDYIFMVSLLQPADGYYKADVYLYYVLTFTLPLVIGWSKKQQT